MKKFLLIILFTVLAFFTTQAQQYQTEMYIKWQLVGQPSWTAPSFYYCVTRSTYPINGSYYFDVYFYSNTYTWDYQYNQKSWRYVYMDNIKITYDGSYGNYGKPISFSFAANYGPPPLRWRTPNRTPIIKLYWNKYYTL